MNYIFLRLKYTERAKGEKQLLIFPMDTTNEFY